MKQRRRSTKGPTIGGIVNQGRGDTTKQGRRQVAKRDVAEMAKVGRDDARKKLKLPTDKEVQEIGRTKEN